ncbi:hypothetical protein KP509_23G044400 [Ceratopteris richardii]|uniref:Pentatricopeptide repeat-containing protein n=1 Tax=Ceratopteris richardii TaxID=49495 RepID=A0A8T2S114_CERRI|nr:hypothetical protein KP509_23G044400 [Ceratopteris richardii]
MPRVTIAKRCLSYQQVYGNQFTLSACHAKREKAYICSAFAERPAGLCEYDESLAGLSLTYRVSEDGEVSFSSLDTYRDALNKCIGNGDLKLGLKLQCHIVNYGHELNNFFGTLFIRLFAACGALSQALQVFSKLQDPNVFECEAIILAHSRHGLYENTLNLYDTFLKSGIQPDGHIFVAALHACTNAGVLALGKCIHFQILESGIAFQSFLLNGILNMYLNCNSINDAFNVFNSSLQKDTVTWNMMLEGCKQHGLICETLQLFNQMQAEGFLLDNVTFISLLQTFSYADSIQQGKIIHIMSVECTSESDPFIVSALINMYSKCSRLDDALELFNAKKKDGDVVIWRVMLNGYACCGSLSHSYALFCQMQQQEGLEIGKRTYASMLHACSCAEALDYGKIIHMYVIESQLNTEDNLARNLIQLYAKCGRLDMANRVFNNLLSCDTAAYTALMFGYGDQGESSKVLELFSRMLHEGINVDEVVVSSVLKATSIEGSDLDVVRLVHTLMEVDGLNYDFHSNTLLVESYVRFDMHEDGNCILFNSLWKCFYTPGQLTDLEYAKASSRTLDKLFVSLLHCCSILQDLDLAQIVHSLFMECDKKWDAETVCSLIDVYASCGMLDDSCSVFKASVSHPVIVWSSMITGYVNHGRTSDALQVFYRMQEEGLQPDPCLCSNILKAFSCPAHTFNGRVLHTRICACKCGSEKIIKIALIDMYARCGSLSDAQYVFNTCFFSDKMTWNALIAGYACNGYLQEAFEFLQAMEKTGCKPDASTFVGMLKGCASFSVLKIGKLVHHLVLEFDCDFNFFLCNSLINMYIKCGSLDNAETFLKLTPHLSKAVWNLIMSGHIESCCSEKALLLFQRMLCAGIMLDNSILVTVLRACSSTGTLSLGMLLHSYVLLGKVKRTSYLMNTIITMYSQCGDLEDAQSVFHKSNAKDAATWNAMIAGCAHNNDFDLASRYFTRMQDEDMRPDTITFLCILSLCCHMGNLEDGLYEFNTMTQSHGIFPTFEHYNCIIDLLGRTGFLLKAADLLYSLPYIHNHVGWMSLLSHCKLHESKDLGNRCINHIVKDQNRNASGYLLMDQVLIHSQHETEADNLKELRTAC